MLAYVTGVSEVNHFQAQIQSIGTVVLEDNPKSATTRVELRGFLDLSQTSNCLVDAFRTCTSIVAPGGVRGSNQSGSIGVVGAD